MTITPSGAPAWTRTAAHTDYGGNTSKRNYGGVGVVDAQTDVGAEEYCRLASDVAAMVRTSPMAVMTLTLNDSSPDAPTFESVYMMTGVRTTSYEGDDAPSGFPSATRNGTGDITITFASSYADDYGVSAPFAPAHAEAGVCDANGAAEAEPDVSGQTVRVRVYSDSGVATADRTITVVVY
jgi:hypothetical protein